MANTVSAILKMSEINSTIFREEPAGDIPQG